MQKKPEFNPAFSFCGSPLRVRIDGQLQVLQGPADEQFSAFTLIKAPITPC